MQYLEQINYNIDLLNDHLTNLAEAIVLAKLNIISKLILNPNEMQFIYDVLTEQSLNLISYEHVYELLGLQAYYNHSNIIFNVKIPILSEMAFQFSHIIPLPINKTKIIVTQPYIAHNEKGAQYFDKACPRIERTFYCHSPLYKEDLNESACIGNLINNKHPRCLFNDVGTTEAIIPIEENFIIFVNVKHLLINSTCSKRPLEIEGTALLRYRSCDVVINGVRYSDNHTKFWERTHIAPPVLTQIEEEATIDTLNLKKLADFYFKNKKAVLILENEADNNIKLTYFVIAILAVLMVATFCVSLVLCFVPATSTSSPLWPSLYSKGGGVTLATPHIRTC
ncbi:uncharacterized protein LOC142225561 [Haematobia irritans]|uniref:uncharacterized protein LOC142225561 n=1 Tax=Haematobia irritans TaxID=7368 RepID=UPI003F4F8D1E